jgi:sorbitol-specific phosphotransferase system component IIBC
MSDQQDEPASSPEPAPQPEPEAPEPEAPTAGDAPAESREEDPLAAEVAAAIDEAARVVDADLAIIDEANASLNLELDAQVAQARHAAGEHPTAWTQQRNEVLDRVSRQIGAVVAERRQVQSQGRP